MVEGANDRLEELPWLEYVAAGGQSHVFGTSRWVVKVPRWSWQSALGRVLVHPSTPVRALATLGGWLEPFELLGRVRFLGPSVDAGGVVAGTRRVWSARWAVVGPRHPSGEFLDRKMAAARPGEAVDLVQGLLDTLEAIRARGWHVLDFIMSNFVVGDNGRVRLVDAGLLVPVSHLRGPSQQMASRVFVSRLARDYREVLAGVMARHPGDAAGVVRLQRVADGLPGRLAAWRDGRVAAVPEAVPVEMPPEMRHEIISRLGGGARRLPLTGRHCSVYTASHHAITSENQHCPGRPRVRGGIHPHLPAPSTGARARDLPEVAEEA